MKIVILILILILALDGIFRDGFLLAEFLSQDFNIPFFFKLLLILIALITTLLLLHSIISEFNILPKPRNRKTSFEKDKDLQNEIETKEMLQLQNYNKNKKLQDKKSNTIPSEPVKKKSKLG
jgi:hypothetical protein